MSDQRDNSPPDADMGGGWRAGSVRWHTRARPHSAAFGDVETTELEACAGLPPSPTLAPIYRNVARRWRFSTWLRDTSR